MKDLLLSCISLLFCLNCWADTPIKLDSKESFNGRHYSSPTVPTIEHDYNILRIYSTVKLDNLLIIIKDDSGTPIYTEITSMPTGKQYILMLPEVESGEYTIELINTDYYFSGNFYINNPKLCF